MDDEKIIYLLNQKMKLQEKPIIQNASYRSGDLRVHWPSNNVLKNQIESEKSIFQMQFLKLSDTNMWLVKTPNHKQHVE
ncbi:MAG: hypothetical protein IPO27_13195 [Bacteroidetes bacterium]|nr:hypothetical protein [Bacteroidota bacterium]